MRLNKTLTTTLTTLGTVLSLGAVACADNVITVKPGDTLNSIASANNTTIAQLQKNNGIQNPNKIQIGQKLKVNSSKLENNYVIVKGGDTLSQIALENGTTVAQLQELNHLSNVNEIMPGQKIFLVSNLQTKSNTATNNQRANNQTASINSKNETNTKVVSNDDTNQTQPVRQNSTINSQQIAMPVNSNNHQNLNQQTKNNVQQENDSIQQTNSKATPVNSSNMSTSEEAAKSWIAQHESGGNYNAINGQYIGKYQLSSSYLHGDYSPANQEKCANEYVSNRYGNWVNAQQHWMAYGWY